MDEKEMRQIHAQSNLMEHLRNLLFSEGLDGCLTGPKFILLSQPVVRENPTGYETTNSVEWQQLFSVNVRTFASVEDLVWFARWVDSSRSNASICEPGEWLAEAEGGRADNIHGSFEWREPKQTVDEIVDQSVSQS
jgi:hypothetical protein